MAHGSAATKKKAEASSRVKGAEPYRPKMTQQEILAAIDKATGPRKGLGELRAGMPTAQVGRPSAAAQAPAPSPGFMAEGAVATPKTVRMAKKMAPPPGLADAAGAAATAIPPLTGDQRETLIDQALLILQDVYANLPLKRALHAIDPIQRLRLLRMRHDALDERAFQSEMIDIFTSLRDLHTNYTLPSAYWSKFAFLPLRVEEYYEGEEHQRRYVISWVSPVNTDKNLKAGVEITHWNGAPIDLAVARNAARQAGSNPEARRARGLEALTLRWLGSALPPDEDWVILTYRSGAKTHESRLNWQVLEREELVTMLAAAPAGTGEESAALGLDIKTELLRRVRKTLFDAPALRAETEMAVHRATTAKAAPPAANGSVLPDVYPRFGEVDTPSGKFAYVRVATFSAPKGDVDGAVDEFVRILKTLPQTGLILDVRGNGGGYIAFGERILQTLTPEPITPEPFHFVTTATTLRIAQSVPWLDPWSKPLITAMSTGAGFSQGFPLTDPEACNDIGQVYQGPVVLVTDAFCYSTTDIFAAGFQDHRIGTVLGCHDNTGAGGANVWDSAQLLQKLTIAPNPFTPLPGGSGMRVAARRSTRVGAQSGVPLEDLGVVPDQRHYMTRADLLDHNVDLIARAAAILAKKDKQTLRIEPDGAGVVSQVRITATNVDRVDLFVGDRPVASVDYEGAPRSVSLPGALAAGDLVAARGFREGQLVVSARLEA